MVTPIGTCSDEAPASAVAFGRLQYVRMRRKECSAEGQQPGSALVDSSQFSRSDDLIVPIKDRIEHRVHVPARPQDLSRQPALSATTSAHPRCAL